MENIKLTMATNNQEQRANEKNGYKHQYCAENERQKI